MLLRLRLPFRSLGGFVRTTSSQSYKATRALSTVCQLNLQSRECKTNRHSHQRSQIQLIEQRRWFWGIDVAFNKVDEERVRLAGPDRAAAEWVLRNGGSIKWTTSSSHLKDYNLLPSTNFESYKIEEIDLSATDVIGLGFEHLKDLHHVRKIKLHGVRTAGDEALINLVHVKDSLEFLEISRCPMITEKGLSSLTELKKLKHLIIYDLIEIRNFETAVNKLKKNMPWCTFTTDDPLHAKPPLE